MTEPDPAPWRRQQSSHQPPMDYVDSTSLGPPPPPPLALGAVPAVRLKSEISEHRPEPPACVQNAMMTKDKKPFTYTPGGLDLSQIRSPRMAKRITRNANAEGVQGTGGEVVNRGVPAGSLPPSALAAMQPQMQVQVFPNGGVPPPPPPPPSECKGNGIGPQQSTKVPSPPLPPYQRPDIKIPENPMGLLRKTGGPIIRSQEFMQQPTEQLNQQQQQPQQQVNQQPLPKQQHQSPPPTPPQQQQPQFRHVTPPTYRPVQPPTPTTPQPKMVKQPESRSQVGTIYIPPLNIEEQQKSPPTQKSATPESPGSPMDTLKKAPRPWLTGKGQQKQEQPSWARSPPETPATPSTPMTPPSAPTAARVIPMTIERTEEATFNQQQAPKQTPAQFKQQQYRQQQQLSQEQQQPHIYRQPSQEKQQPHVYRQQQQQQQQQKQQHVVHVIPIQIEGQTQRPNAGPMSPASNLSTPDLSGEPIQSPTFRILQRVTSRDEELHNQPAVQHPPTVGQTFPVDQVRRMQLTDDDRSLMNRFKNQVDEDSFLHNEEDPRYRGPAIPSRAFRMLQSMTDAAEASGDPMCVPRAVIVNRGPQQQQPGGVKRNQPRTPQGGENTLPPSEQRAPEPRKYTGSAIPSRSFQMLQAMVAPENCANGTETDDKNANYPGYYPWDYNSMYPPPLPYWYNPYWMSYHEPSPGEETKTTNVNENETNNQIDENEYYAQMVPYWDPYYAAYYASYYGFYPPPPPPLYSPHAFYHSNETDDYSSADEMSYYASRFPQAMPSGRTSAQSVELSKEIPKSGSLQAIRSVSDVRVYETDGKISDVSSAVEEDTSDTSDDESESTEDGTNDTEDLPHELSVIFEESEISEADRKLRETSIATTASEDSSTTIGGAPEVTEELLETTVTVKLPLKLKYPKTKNRVDEVTDLKIGSNQIECGTTDNTSMVINFKEEYSRQQSDETIVNEEASETAQDDDDIDFWEEINKSIQSDHEMSVPKEKQELDNKIELKTSSGSDDDSGKYNFKLNENILNGAEGTMLIDQNLSDESSSSDDSDSEVEVNKEVVVLSKNTEVEEFTYSDDDNTKLDKDLRISFTSDAVKERFRALRELGKMYIGADLKEEALTVKQRISAIENNTGSTTSSVLSEEDGDSGVTDISRESESYSDRLRRRYQRAATHSRLFKLLQDECAKEDDNSEFDDFDNEEQRKRLTLPLSEPESFASSGICSPTSPSWLARELVHGLLGGHQGKKYKALPLERLYAAAQRILQEDALSNTSEDGSPLDSYSSDYRSYYSTWEDSGTVKKQRFIRCPRIKSEKNIPALSDVEELPDTTSLNYQSKNIPILSNVEELPDTTSLHYQSPNQQATSAS